MPLLRHRGSLQALMNGKRARPRPAAAAACHKAAGGRAEPARCAAPCTCVMRLGAGRNRGCVAAPCTSPAPRAPVLGAGPPPEAPSDWPRSAAGPASCPPGAAPPLLLGDGSASTPVELSAAPCAASLAGTRPRLSASATSVGLRSADHVSALHILPDCRPAQPPASIETKQLPGAQPLGMYRATVQPHVNNTPHTAGTPAGTPAGFCNPCRAPQAPAGPLDKGLPPDGLQRRPQPRAQRRGQALKLRARDLRAEAWAALQNPTR